MPRDLNTKKPFTQILLHYQKECQQPRPPDTLSTLCAAYGDELTLVRIKGDID